MLFPDGRDNPRLCYAAVCRFWLLISFESLHLGALHHIFLRGLKGTVKAAPPYLSQRLQLEKALEHGLKCFAEEGSGRQEVSSAAAEQLCSAQSCAGKGKP